MKFRAFVLDRSRKAPAFGLVGILVTGKKAISSAASRWEISNLAPTEVGWISLPANTALVVSAAKELPRATVLPTSFPVQGTVAVVMGGTNAR